MRIGYYFPEKKLKKQGISEFLDFAKQALYIPNVFSLVFSSLSRTSTFHCSSHGLQMIPLDLTQNLEAQGPFDVLIHKVTDLVTSEHPADKQQMENFKTYTAAHLALPVLDPLDSTLALTNRISTLKVLRETVDESGGLFYVPHSVVLEAGQPLDPTVFKFPIS